MRYEQETSRERSKELPKPVFDLEQMEIRQVGMLIAAMGSALEVELEAIEREGGDRKQQSGELIRLLGCDLQNLPARDPKRASELFASLANHDNLWPRELAADHLGAALLRSQSDDYSGQQQTIALWTQLLEDEEALVREAATSSISTTVDSEWLDETTARYLDSKLPAAWQREDWWT